MRCPLAGEDISQHHPGISDNIHELGSEGTSTGSGDTSALLAGFGFGACTGGESVNDTVVREYKEFLNRKGRRLIKGWREECRLAGDPGLGLKGWSVEGMEMGGRMRSTFEEQNGGVE